MKSGPDVCTFGWRRGWEERLQMHCETRHEIAKK